MHKQVYVVGILQKLPWLLIVTRISLTPFAALFGLWGYVGLPYVILMAMAALSDVYDGKLARRYNVETANVRQWDSIADTIFFIGVFVGMCLAYPVMVKQFIWGVSSILGLEVIRYIFDFIKFGRGASYHATSAKVFGVSLLVATIAIMGFSTGSLLMQVALVIGIISELEGLLISIVLGKWTYNVKNIFKALEISG